MRSAALVFGLLAGALGALAIAYGNIATGLAVIPALGGDAAAAETVLYAVIALGLVGAGLVLFWPRVGGVFMLLAGIAWAVAAFLAGHGAVLFAALPFTFVGAGGLVGLFTRRRESTELALAEPHGRQWDDDEEEGPAYAPTPRGLRGREPDFAPVARRPQPAPPAPTYAEDEDPEEDYVDADVEQEPEDGEYEESEDDEPPVEGEAEEAADDNDDGTEENGDEPREGAAGSQRGGWSLPDPQQSPAPRRARERYVPERQQAAPVRLEPTAERPSPQAARRPARQEAFDLDEQDFSPARREFQPQPRNTYREFEPYDPVERAPQRRGALRGFLRLLVLLIFVLVIAGIAAAVYFDYERGPNSILFGSHAARVAAAPRAAIQAPAIPAPAATPSDDTANTPAPATDTASGLAAPADASNTPASTASANGASTEATAAPAAAPAAPAPAVAANAPPTYADPFAYCHAVDTADTPDSSYTGPAVPASVLAAAGPGADASQVHWRCANTDVLACNANHGAACDLTPTVDLMLSYCASHPNAGNIPAPNGFWSCNGKRPVIPTDQKWPVDARGFFPGAWKVVAPPSPGG